MDLGGHGAGALAELADDEGVNVLVSGVVEETGLGGLGGDGAEGGGEGGALFEGQDPDAFEGARPGLGAEDVGVEEPAVEVERAGEALEDLGGRGFESSSPEFHGCGSCGAEAPRGLEPRVMACRPKMKLGNEYTVPNLPNLMRGP